MAVDHQARLAEAFPPALDAEAAVVAALVPPCRLDPAGQFTVLVLGADLAIPYRIYNDDVPGEHQQALTPTQRILLSCWYTRHHNGFVRQRHLEQIVRFPLPWVAPYVTALMGEYVLEILELIRRELVDLDQPGTAMYEVYGRFAAENPAFIALTAHRVASYWDCYFRSRYASRAHHPGTTLIAALTAAARSRRAPVG